jgi:hypothetical protein
MTSRSRGGRTAVAALGWAALLAIGCRRPSDECFHHLDPGACRELCALRDTTMGGGTACLIWGNYDKAAQHEAFDQGCRQGNAGACNRLTEIEPDPARKKAAHAAACADPVYATACLGLADLETDPGARRAALEAGCRGGDDRACERFAPLEPDRTRRRAIFEESCQRGYRSPCPRVIALDREP